MVNIRQITDISSGFDLEKEIKKHQKGIDYVVDKTGNYYTILSEELKKIIWPGDYLNYAESIVAIDREGKINSWRISVEKESSSGVCEEREKGVAKNITESKENFVSSVSSERGKVLWKDNHEIKKHHQSLSEFREKKRWMELVLWETENEFHGKCDYKNGWSKEKQLNSIRESITGWENKIQYEKDWLARNDAQQRDQIGTDEERDLIISKERNDKNFLSKDNFNSWTKEQFVSEIKHLKAEIEELKNSKFISSSEKQEKINKSQQKLEKLEKLEKSYSANALDNNSNAKSNSLSTNLAIGGGVLVLVGLVSFLVIRKSAKVKKRS